MPSMPIQISLEERMAKIGINALVVINKRGNIVDSFGDDELNLSKEKREVLFMQTALQCSMQDEQNDELGKTRFFMAKRDKSKFFCQRLDADKIAIAIADRQANNNAVIRCVGQLNKLYNTVPEKGQMVQL